MWKYINLRFLSVGVMSNSPLSLLNKLSMFSCEMSNVSMTSSCEMSNVSMTSSGAANFSSFSSSSSLSSWKMFFFVATDFEFPGKCWSFEFSITETLPIFFLRTFFFFGLSVSEYSSVSKEICSCSPLGSKLQSPSFSAAASASNSSTVNSILPLFLVNGFPEKEISKS